MPNFITPPPCRLWLNHQVLLVINSTGRTPAPASRWRASASSLKASSSLCAELFGFETPVAAARAVSGASTESAQDFIVPAHAGMSAAALLSFLRTALTWNLPIAEKHLLAERLRLIHETTRKPCPPAIFAGRPLLCIDLVARTGDCSVYLKGWWRDCHGQPIRLTAISPEGERCDLLDNVTPFSRDDIDPAYAGDIYTGFTISFQLEQPSLLLTGWRVEVESADGFLAEAPAPTALEESGQILAAILPDLQIERPPLTGNAAAHVHDFITRLQAGRLENYSIKEELQFGPPVLRPVLSVIIPLYGRIDLIEHQLAQFALDPVWAQCDLIYLVDSPELWQRVAWRAEWLAQLYHLSLRVIRGNRSGGYAAVNNLGAKRARADLLLFLNSDVLPITPGWIERMVASYRQRPGIGALGPKLLFEDNSIQHAGVGFTAATDGFGWDTLPYYKGFHRNFSAATQTRPVTAITGACLMVDKALFHRVNGFDQGYIQGDFEDMDLCLRLRRAGCQNWYDASIELYHLEGVSYPQAQRVRHATYNRWLHSRKWSNEIERLITPNGTPAMTVAQISA